MIKAADLVALIGACEASAILYAGMADIEAKNSGFLSPETERYLDEVVAAERRAAALRAVAARLI